MLVVLVQQVIVASGTVCVFHVGGCREAAATADKPGAASVQRWEFFIGDRPHTAAMDADGRRQPMVQIAAADRLVQSGDSHSIRFAAVFGMRDKPLELKR